MLTQAEIRNVRKTLRMSQTQFAKLLGVHPMTVSRWERGEVAPDSATARFLQTLGAGLQKKKPEAEILNKILKAVAAGAAIAGMALLLAAIFERKGR